MISKYLYKTPCEFDDLIITMEDEHLIGLTFNINGDFIDNKAVKNSSELLNVIKWLDLYFSKEIPNFLPNIKFTNCSKFQLEVYQELIKVPFGKTSAYGDLAKIVALKRGIKKMSSQAIGNALKNNPICIIYPCHRIIGKNGSLVGYNGGLRNKEALLNFEAKII